MDNGWIKLHRILKNKPIWKNSTPEQKSVLITLLLMANREEKEWEWKGEKFKVLPGQFVTSLESIKKETGKGVSVQNVRSSLNRFKKLQFLTYKSTKSGRIISICNWESYQQNVEDAQQSDQQRGNKGATTNKNHKNHKKYNNIKLHSRNFENFQKVVSYFDKKFYDEKSWLDCYDKLIRIDKYSENRILEIVKEFRSDGNWWKDNGNFESLLKLRQKNKDKIKYIDLFDKKLNNSGFNPSDTRTQPDMENFNPKF
jgi:hypothetical protein